MEDSFSSCSDDRLRRHLDGTVLISGAGRTVFKSLAQLDDWPRDAERANVTGNRRRDRYTALTGIQNPSRLPDSSF
jgi:hypothetical protein